MKSKVLYVLMLQPRYDQWQLWHVLGKPYSIDLVNAFGANITSLLKAGLLNLDSNGNAIDTSDSAINYHGAFIDSCTHHCTSCSVTGENSWYGEHIKSQKEKENLTPAQSFQLWYNEILTKIHSPHDGNLDNVVRNRFFIQEGQYPCDDCCTCRA
jgi:hypothetical protein